MLISLPSLIGGLCSLLSVLQTADPIMGLTMQTSSDDLGLTTDMFQAGAAGGAMAGTMATSDGHR